MHYYMGAKPIKLNLENKPMFTRKVGEKPDGVVAYQLAEDEIQGRGLYCVQWPEGNQNIVWLNNDYFAKKYLWAASVS